MILAFLGLVSFGVAVMGGSGFHVGGAVWGALISSFFVFIMYTMFITNNHTSFHLWRKENLVKHQKVLKYYVHDCIILFLKSKLILFSVFYCFYTFVKLTSNFHTLQVNNSIILRIQNETFSGYYFYMNTNI